MQRNSLIKNFFKGLIIGIGKIIPGVSGAMLAITLGIYDKSLYHLNNFKVNKRESIKYLTPIALGIILAIIIFSKIISLSLSNYYLITMLFFVGLIIGGIPSLTSKVSKKDYPLVIITFLIFLIISVSSLNNNYILKNNFLDIIIFIISGFIEAIGTIVPGISSTALLLIIGTYNIIISSIGDITNFSLLITNLRIIIPFTLGLIIGIIIMIKVIDILFKKYKSRVYSFILGILLSNIFVLIAKTFNKKVHIGELIIGCLLLVLGILISNMMEEK